jgi:response regulator RpfG family c-di-GMP phosphodiesterase
LDGKPIDGVGLCQRIKRSTADRPVPVILVTANAMRGDAERLLHESGADDYVSKPIQDHDGLLQLVVVHLATAQAVACDELLPCGEDCNLPGVDKPVGNLLHQKAG